MKTMIHRRQVSNMGLYPLSIMTLLHLLYQFYFSYLCPICDFLNRILFMNKLKYVLIIGGLLLNSYNLSSNPVTQQTAFTVATNFYTQNIHQNGPGLNLAYTEYSSDNQPVYYVFNAIDNEGFVIISAEDAAHPVLAYSNKGSYLIPKDNNNVAWWLNCRKQEIEYARTKNIAATAGIADEWNQLISNSVSKAHNPFSIVGPLLQTTWDQVWPYNIQCPDGFVTGCVATAMAQIMKYWSYPPSGHGSTGYWDEQAYGCQNNIGYLSANYDTSHYNWSAMPLSVSNVNNPVAELMYDCGVSVDMDYSVESGSWVITGDYPVCAQVAFVKYFGYDRATIQGLYQSKYSITNWESLIENELNNGRPIEYVGWDSISPNNEPGHTWVCDGYNSGNNTFDMNWGWGGSDNGWYALNALDAGGYQFNWWNEALIGIEPPDASPYFVATPTFGCKGMNVQFTDQSIVPSNIPIIVRQWLFPGGTPSASTAVNPTVVYNNAGTYDVTEIIGTPHGTDTLVRHAYIAVDSVATLPFHQGFEALQFPPAGWANYNPNFYSYVWQLNTGFGGFGKSGQCMYFNNCQGYQDYAPPGKAGTDVIGQRQQIYSPKYDFTNTAHPEIYFDVAYAPYSTVFSDTLAIYYSTDCGTTFIPIYVKGGLTLGTTGNYVTSDTNKIGCFVPSPTNWRTDTIHIQAIAGMNNVLFSFENRSGNGSPLYIDNINISDESVAGVATMSTNPSITVYPNPGNGNFTFVIASPAEGGTWQSPSIEIYNVLGEKVYSNYQITKSSNFQINLSNQPAGVYIYRIFSATGAPISEGKLVIE